MIIVAILLIAIAVVLTAAAVTSNGHQITFDLWDIVDSKVSVGVVFIAGMITTVIAVGGIALLLAGLKRKRRTRKERKELNRQQEQLTATPDLLSSMPDLGIPDVPSTDQTGKKTP
jgi:uncharacterized membrane protein YciS (DUF1049 family)